jgi:hypothetical protein
MASVEVIPPAAATKRSLLQGRRGNERRGLAENGTGRFGSPVLLAPEMRLRRLPEGRERCRFRTELVPEVQYRGRTAERPARGPWCDAERGTRRRVPPEANGAANRRRDAGVRSPARGAEPTPGTVAGWSSKESASSRTARRMKMNAGVLALNIVYPCIHRQARTSDRTKKGYRVCRNPLICMVGATGIEPVAPAV